MPSHGECMFRFPLLVAFVMFVVSLSAQTPDTATLRGQVLDPTRAAVSGAEIRITDARLGTERSAHSDSSGRFSFSGLPAGSYRLMVHKERFAELSRDLT